MRAIPVMIKSVDELGLPDAVTKLAKQERGIILLTGTTGSGKSTTLAAMIDHMNRTMKKHIVTIEDPIEFLHRDRNCIINQREVGQDTASFKRALRRVLRQDPDVILVGEMRDEETVHTALSAAETGHLVLSTLHTVDAPETVNRIIDFFPPHQQQQARAMIAGTLKGIVSQRLVKTADGHGRVACCEIMVMTGRVHDMILDPKLTGQLPEVVAEGGYYGMQTFDQHLLKHLQAGRITYEEAMRAATSPHDFKLMVAASGPIADLSRGAEPEPQIAGDARAGPVGRAARRLGAAARRRLPPGSPALTPGAAVARLSPMQTTLGQFNETQSQDAFALQNSKLLKVQPRPGDRPGQARLDGRLPGRRDLRARWLGRSRPDAQEGRHRRGHAADEDDRPGRGVPRRHGAGHPPDLPRERHDHGQRAEPARVRHRHRLGHQARRGRERR